MEPPKSQEVPVVYVSVCGGVATIERKSKGVVVIVREHDEEKERGAKAPYLITYSVYDAIECGDEFFAVR